jgi:hypothetical protein
MIEQVVDNWNDTVAELIDFIEYEEAMTADPKTQERIRQKLIELKVWEKID